MRKYYLVVNYMDIKKEAVYNVQAVYISKRRAKNHLIKLLDRDLKDRNYKNEYGLLAVKNIDI